MVTTTWLVRWRTALTALPAVALVGTGAALAASGPETAAAVARTRPAVTVPPLPLLRADAPALPPLPPLPPLPAERAATIVGAFPAGGLPASMRATGIPVGALAAYHRAADSVGAADAACRLDWALLAAIGSVESDHGRYAGNRLDAGGTARPGIYGIALDGRRGTALIRDTDAGALDRDPVWDRAVGPMQFIPGTWRTAGTDGNGDGVADPQNIADAAAAAAVYLCSGPGDLTRAADLRAAVLRYNASESYVGQVIATAQAYRRGVTALPWEPPTAGQLSGAPHLPGAPGAGSAEPQGQSRPAPPRAASTSSRPASSNPPAPGPPSAHDGTRDRAEQPPAAPPSQDSGKESGQPRGGEPVTSEAAPLATVAPPPAPASSGTAPAQTCVVDALGATVCSPL
jgi:hypothetical protein